MTAGGTWDVPLIYRMPYFSMTSLAQGEVYTCVPEAVFTKTELLHLIFSI
jgi:hypothetical protein